MNTMTCNLERVPSPIGDALLVTDDRGRVLALDWADHDARLRRLLDLQWGRGRTSLVARPGPSRARAAVEAYFAGDVSAVDQVEVATGGTAFQRAVWAELRRIAAGEVVSYTELAARLGRPDAVRAVARANATNPVSVIVGCHRVVGADGALTGYAGGLQRKRWLLEHERRHAPAAALAGGVTA